MCDKKNFQHKFWADFYKNFFTIYFLVNYSSSKFQFNSTCIIHSFISYIHDYTYYVYIYMYLQNISEYIEPINTGIFKYKPVQSLLYMWYHKPKCHNPLNPSQYVFLIPSSYICTYIWVWNSSIFPTSFFLFRVFIYLFFFSWSNFVSSRIRCDKNCAII